MKRLVALLGLLTVYSFLAVVGLVVVCALIIKSFTG